jgi:hypothetical protein
LAFVQIAKVLPEHHGGIVHPEKNLDASADG